MTLYCPFCAHPNEAERIKTFQDGEVYERLKCEQCGKWVYLDYVKEAKE